MSAAVEKKALSPEELAQKVEQTKLRKIDRLIEQNRDKEGSLIQVLHNTQEIYGYLPLFLQERIAKGLNKPLSEVSGVVTFYALFSTEPRAKHIVRVCMGTACYVRGGQRIVDRLEQELGIAAGETTPDKKFAIEITRCLGACGLAPIVMIGDDVHQRLEPDQVPGMLAQY